MNTKPDNETLALWVEDELDTTSTAKIDLWATDHPDWLAQRDLARRSRKILSSSLMAEEPVPHAEFFNARIHREIEQSATPASQPKTTSPAKPWHWLVPLTAAASITLGFWLGNKPSNPNPDPTNPELEPVLYTPDKSVQAELIPAEDATLIVLNGVTAIPDSWSLPETASLQPDPPSMATTLSP